MTHVVSDLWPNGSDPRQRKRASRYHTPAISTKATHERESLAPQKWPTNVGHLRGAQINGFVHHLLDLLWIMVATYPPDIPKNNCFIIIKRWFGTHALYVIIYEIIYVIYAIYDNVWNNTCNICNNISDIRNDICNIRDNTWNRYVIYVITFVIMYEISM